MPPRGNDIEMLLLRRVILDIYSSNLITCAVGMNDEALFNVMLKSDIFHVVYCLFDLLIYDMIVIGNMYHCSDWSCVVFK